MRRKIIELPFQIERMRQEIFKNNSTMIADKLQTHRQRDYVLFNRVKNMKN